MTSFVPIRLTNRTNIPLSSLYQTRKSNLHFRNNRPSSNNYKNPINKINNSQSYRIPNDYINNDNSLFKNTNDHISDLLRNETNLKIELSNKNKKINEYEELLKIQEHQIEELQAKYDNICVWVGEQKLKTPADPYTEQRKWIGKLCKFWNKTEYTDDLYGVLTDIVSTNKYKPEDNYFVPFKDEFGSFYEHCEPIKPDDDIIYKGEQ
jgi:hypothetical protein